MNMSDWNIIVSVVMAVSFGFWRKSVWAAIFMAAMLVLIVGMTTRTTW